MLRDTAEYTFGSVITRIIPLNDDQSIPLPTAVDPAGEGALIGGFGPFDFSDIDSSDAAIPIIGKINDGAEDSQFVDLSGAVSIAAVTGAELRDALTAAGLTGATFTLQALTERIHLVFDTGEYWQLYGECALVALFGQGLGMEYIKSDTIESLQVTPNVKDANTLTTTDGNGLDTEVVLDSYRKGSNLVMLDTADDPEMRQIMEGGQLEGDDYDTPTSEDDKVYFMVETFQSKYTRGTNKEADLVGYQRKRVRSAVGAFGDITHQLDWAGPTYNLVATSYKKVSTSETFGDIRITQLTKEEFAALDVANV